VLDQDISEGDTFASVTTERLEADVQTGAAILAAATCEWFLKIAELDRREAWASWECRSMAHWLSWKCALSIRTGREHVRIARDLERLPRVVAEFAAGRLSYSKVRALTRLVVAPETEADLVETALRATASQLDLLAAGCQRVRRTNDPERERRIHEERRLSLVLDDDGSGRISLWGPVDLIAEFKAAVDGAVGDEPANDGEGIEQRRFDAAIAIARRYQAPQPEAAPRAAIVIRVEGTASADLDVVSSPRAHGLPISRAAYERFRCDAAVAVERALDDGSIERTPAVDAIPRRIRRAVLRRDLGTCRWPGCGSRAAIHVHHIIWRSRCGPNDIDNLVSLCHYHHRAIHHRGWEIRGNANGPLQFVDVRGRIADERTDRRVYNHEGALVRAQAASGFTPSPETIATALGDRLDRDWAVAVICHNEEIHQRRN
jgi:Domain of unknown function (DUF222)/HNH endonuclease